MSLTLSYSDSSDSILVIPTLPEDIQFEIFGVIVNKVVSWSIASPEWKLLTMTNLITHNKWLILTVLLVFISAYLVETVLPSTPENECGDSKVKNIASLYKRINSIVENSEILRKQSIGKVIHDGVGYDIWLISRKSTSETKRRVFINAGLHGDEPGGVESVIEYLNDLGENPTLYPDIEFDFIPLVNPWGWANCNRFTADNVDTNRQFHENVGQEIKLIDVFLRYKRYDLMIDHHEDPRDHVDAFYIVTYGNDDLSAIQSTVERVKEMGFKLRPFKRTIGYFNVKKKKMSKLKNKTFMLYARANYGEVVYQIETPTILTMEERVTLHNVANDILISGLYK